MKPVYNEDICRELRDYAAIDIDSVGITPDGRFVRAAVEDVDPNYRINVWAAYDREDDNWDPSGEDGDEPIGIDSYLSDGDEPFSWSYHLFENHDSLREILDAILGSYGVSTERWR